MARDPQPGIQRALLGGVVAGIVGGVAVSVFLLIVNLVQARDVWVGMKVPAIRLIGDAALQPGFAAGPVLLGAAIHFAVSIAWGLIFGLFVYGTTKTATIWLGAVWGIVVWIGMYYVVLPFSGLNTLARSVPLWLVISEHVLFGLAVGLGFLPFQRTRARERRRPIGKEPINP